MSVASAAWRWKESGPRAVDVEDAQVGCPGWAPGDAVAGEQDALRREMDFARRWQLMDLLA
ncbi:hypothetical protein [Streptomyces sp. NPDC002851]